MGPYFGQLGPDTLSHILCMLPAKVRLVGNELAFSAHYECCHMVSGNSTNTYNALM